jgi:small subunit ribosomal protein S17
MADKKPTPGADIADEPEETQEVATAVDAPNEAEETAATAEPAAPVKAAAQAKPAKSAAPAKSAVPIKPAATKATTPAKPAAKAPKEHARRAGEPSAAGGAAEPRTGRRKVREGIVISNSMEKTAVVAIIERVRHPRYAKTVQRTKRLYAHDEANDTRVGDRVRLSETRPLSKLKRWRVDQVLERAR